MRVRLPGDVYATVSATGPMGWKQWRWLRSYIDLCCDDPPDWVAWMHTPEWAAAVRLAEEHRRVHQREAAWPDALRDADGGT